MRERALERAAVVALVSIVGCGGGGSSGDDAGTSPPDGGVDAGRIDGGGDEGGGDGGATPVSQDVLPEDRRADWTNVGVAGGIPDTTGWTLVNVQDAPYNAAGDGAADDTSAIARALDDAASRTVVYLPAGTYRTTSGLNVEEDDIVIRGAGPASTTIRYTGASAEGILVWNDSGPDKGPNLSVTAGATRGSVTLTLSDASSLAAGDLVVLTQTNPSFVDPDGDNGLCDWCGQDDSTRVMSQVDKVVSKSGNDITLEHAVYLDMTNSPRINEIIGAIHGGGVEDLTIERVSAESGVNIYADAAEGFWVRNVVSERGGNDHVRLQRSYRCEIRDSTFDDGFDHGSDHSYGIWMFSWNSAHLVENNILSRLRHAVNYEGGGSGTVIGYNYLYDSFSDDPGFLSETLDTHGAHPYMNLFEGNVTANITHDWTFGSSSHNVTFRTWIINTAARATAGRWGYVLQYMQRYNSIVGSIIGRNGDSGDQFADASTGWEDLSSYAIGGRDLPRGSPLDAETMSTLFIHGTYDFIGDEVRWDASHAERTLPASLYLGSRPSWFGSLAWPPFDPGAPLEADIDDIPAGYRAVHGTLPP